MQEVERTLHIDVDDGIPLGLAHAHDQAVFGDAGVVHQDVDAAEIGYNLLYHGLGSLEVGGVGGIGAHLHAEGFQLFHRLLGGFVDDQVRKGDVGALGGIFKGDGFADAPGGTRNEGHLSF